MQGGIEESGKARLLLVDDEAVVLELMEAILVNEGHRVSAVLSARSALDLLEGDEPIDLLVTDVKMPNVDGFELAKLAKAFRPSLKVLFVSAYSDTVTAELAETGFNANLLRKPFTAKVLIREVARALKSVL